MAIPRLLRSANGLHLPVLPPAGERKAPSRHAGLCKLKPEMYDQYTQLHDHTWDEVMEKMYNANMRNFVVYLHEETMQMYVVP